MHPLSLVIFLTLAAGSDRPIPAGCREDHQTCREDCTIDYGGSTTKYRQLTACIQRCDKGQKECASRYYTLQDAQIDPMTAREPDPAMREPEPYESADKSSTEPASDKEEQPSGSTVRRGVYRAADEAPPAPAEPPAPVEPAVKKEPVAEPKATPRPEPKPAATSNAAPAPSPEKEEVPIFDKDEPEPAPAPKPAPKPVEPLHPPPPPEPKKKDISDWDPNGD